MRLTLRNEILPLVLIAASWGLVAYYWPHLPEQVPTHWGVSGQPNQWAPRLPGAMIGPLVGTFLYVLFSVIPAIDPRSAHWEKFGRIYPVLKNVMVAFSLLLTYLSLSAAASPSHRLSHAWLVVGIGLLFLVLGNYLPKVRSNFFVGIRTPWTLSNDEVWDRTHRVGGKLMMLAGLVMLVGAWLPDLWSMVVVLGAAAVSGLVPVVYSYLLYRKLAKAT